MQEIELNELKKIEFNLLIQFKNVCEENNLRYSLGGGSLLGAIRHNGFIPWDDDIDVFMPRKDYDLFIDYCMNNDTSFGLVCYKNTPSYNYLFAKIINKETFLVDELIKWEKDESGVFIDIFPIDGLGDSFKEARNTINKTKRKRELLVACNWNKYFRSKTHKWYLEPLRLGLFLLSRLVNPKKLTESIDSSMKSKDFSSSKYCGCICGVYRENEIMPDEVFKQYGYVSFEGNTFSSIKNYDYYLSRLYKDYMSLPPLNKRRSQHSFNAYWKNEDEK